jgi:hypothetical protein
MLDPGLYRKGLIVVLFGVIVFAFSLQGPPAPLAPDLAPDAYSAAAVTATLRALARRFPDPSAASASDRRLAGQIAAALSADGFAIDHQRVGASGAADGGNVIATRPGLSPQTVAVVAARGLPGGGPAAAQLSASAVLLELGTVLGSQTNRDTIVLASTVPGTGGGGTDALARLLAAQPIDAVIVLGDLVRRHPTEPIVVPWSDGRAVAPLRLRQTLASAIAQETSLRASTPGLPSQLAHGALPLTISDQGPFGARDMPAVLLSAAGERGPTPHEAIAPAQAGALGAAVLQSVDALASAPAVGSPSAYLSIDGQSVPAWAVRLLVATLILPVLALAIDGAARARRRRAQLGRSVALTLACALPGLVCLLTIKAFSLLGAVPAPPEPTGPGTVQLSAAAIAMLTLAGITLLGGLGWFAARAARQQDTRARGPALLLVASVVTLTIWALNPLAALLLVPALHVWPWLVDEESTIGRPARIALALLPLLAPALVLTYYALADGFTAPALSWSLVLMVAAGRISMPFAVLWSLALGCLLSAVTLALRARRAVAAPAITVRGPLGYAGPGSLGGTESALRR